MPPSIRYFFAIVCGSDTYLSVQRERKKEYKNKTTTATMGNDENDQKANCGVASRLARPNILELHPYRCARDDYSEGILLDANENAYGPPVQNSAVLERYPDPYQIPLKQKLAAYRGYGIQTDNLFVGVGSDEAIDLLMRIFCMPGKDKILTTPPTYGMYKVCAKVNDVGIVNVPLTPEFDVRVPETLAAITPDVKLLFLCSPGNPTCKTIPLADIEAVASAEQAKNCVVVVDEAYVDFAAKGTTALSVMKKYPNMVVLQTLSKAFGLAAIRCGFCFGAPDIIQLMNNVKAPYNVNALTSQMACQALDNTDTLHKTVQTILEERQAVANALNEIDFVVKVFPSDANFLLFQLQSKAKEVYQAMANGGIVTRYRGNELHCDECIRVTIGTPEENRAFLESLVKTYRSL